MQQDIKSSDFENTDYKEVIKEEAKGLWISLKVFLIDLLDFRADTDRMSTVEAIKEDVSFRGATAWILMCSVVVASVGLNANSTAVVIGAMLISPLMGPILGLGLSIAINDIDTFRKSFVNFGVMVVLSVLTAFLFFKTFPLSEETSELFARTKPDIRDVLIAFFGGLALIIARTKKGTIASVIFGVAIATALIPPLCTVGYGLALSFEDLNKGLRFAWGALYLFLINTIFIALATFIVLKLLRFPMLKYANSKRRKTTARVASLVALLAMIPAGFTFYTVLKQSNFKKDAIQFIATELTALPHAEYVKNNAIYRYSENENEKSIIELNSFGLDEVPETSIALLRHRLTNYPSLKNTELIFNQNKSKNIDNLRYMEELRSRDSLDLLSQSQKIRFLEEKVAELSPLEKDKIPFENLSREAKINYENLETISYSKTYVSNFENIDTLIVFKVAWKADLADTIKQKNLRKLSQWFKFKLRLDNLKISEMGLDD